MRLLISIILLSLIGCKENNVHSEYDILNDNDPLKVIEIDNCEYLFGNWGYYTVLTHKGNCKYCKERYDRSL